jgi:two-component system sensor histidine kinase DctS
MGSLGVLAAAIVWSLWQLRRHMQRRQAAEQALRAEHAFRKAMEDSLNTGMRARDLKGRITYVNPAFCRMVGWSAEELVGLLPPMPYWAPEALERTLAVHEMVLGGNAPPQGIEIRLMRRSGERFDALLIEAPLIDAAGRHTGWMGSVLDITEQKRARELPPAGGAPAGRAAPGHDGRDGVHAGPRAQPAAGRDRQLHLGCINRLQDEAHTRPRELLDIHQRIARQAQRAGEIIRRVHDFVRRSEPKREPLDLNAVIRDAIGLIEADARKRAHAHPQRARRPTCRRCAADAVMIEQIAVNLVRNAWTRCATPRRPTHPSPLRTAREGGR